MQHGSLGRGVKQLFGKRDRACRRRPAFNCKVLFEQTAPTLVGEAVRTRFLQPFAAERDADFAFPVATPRTANKQFRLAQHDEGCLGSALPTRIKTEPSRTE